MTSRNHRDTSQNMGKKKLKLFLFLVVICCSTLNAAPDKICQEWFEKASLKPNSDCELKCASIRTSMATFYCASQCKELCKANISQVKSRALGKVLYYPGLTSEEKRLVEKYPKDALIVFIQKERAEISTDRNFPQGALNDESDAFRHFVWAGLLTKELDSEKAKLFLDAHESNPHQPPAEKAMDLANNRDGILVAQRLEKSKNLNLKSLEIEALKELKEGRLTVLKPGLPIPKEPK